MNGAQIQELVGEARMRADWLERRSARTHAHCMRELADALQAFQRSIVAHHDIANLSEEAIKESLGGPCQICARAQE